MPDSPSAWLRSLAAEAARANVMVGGGEFVPDYAARTKARRQLESIAPDLAVLCADAIDALESVQVMYLPGTHMQKIRDLLSRFAALQPKEPS